MTEHLGQALEVYSDSSGYPGIPNLVETGTGPDDEAAKWLKMSYMFKIWATPPYRKVKWFVIAHEAIYLNIANLWQYLNTLDHTKPMIIGDLHCTEDGTKYADGRAGIIVSLGALRDLDWFIFNAPLRTIVRRSDHQYDAAFGQYAARKSVPLFSHPGMLSSSYSENSDLYRHFNAFTDTADTHRTWKYPIRPITSDQTQEIEFLPTLHNAMSSIAYDIKSTPQASEIGFNCSCQSGRAGKCVINKPEAAECTESQPTLACLALSED